MNELGESSFNLRASSILGIIPMITYPRDVLGSAVTRPWRSDTLQSRWSQTQQK